MTEEPAYDYNAERGVIACCIIDPDCIGKCLDRRIDHTVFYDPVHQMVFKALRDLWDSSPEIDELTLAEKIRELGWYDEVGGLAGINAISNCAETSLHFDMWAELVEDHSASRQLRVLCNQTLDSIAERKIHIDKVLDAVDAGVVQISKDRCSQEFFHNSKESVSIARAAIERRRIMQGMNGIPTGIHDLDVRLKGFKNTELTLLAARPSVGKTAFSLHCFLQAVLNENIPTLYQSIEMSASSLMQRIVQSMANIRLELVEDGLINPNQEKAMDDAQRKLENSKFWIDETPSPSVSQIRARARRLKSSGLGFIIIDYLQLVRPRDTKVPREQQVAEMSNSIKNLSKELDIPILLLCQLNRQSEIAQRGPKLSDLRESGQLEQDCDVCLMLWKPEPEEEPSMVRCSIAKNRNGQTGFADMNFQRNTQRFSAFEDEQVDIPQQTNQTRFGI